MCNVDIKDDDDEEEEEEDDYVDFDVLYYFQVRVAN